MNKTVDSLNKSLNMSDFLKYYKQLSKSKKRPIPALMTNDGNYVYDSEKKANFIAQFFINYVQFLPIKETYWKQCMNIFLRIASQLASDHSQIMMSEIDILRTLQHIERTLNIDHWIQKDILKNMPSLIETSKAIHIYLFTGTKITDF